MDVGALPWGSPVFDVFKGLFPFLRLARLLHQGTMCDLKLAMCGAPDDVLVYAHSYFLALAADRTGDREFPAHEHVSQLFMIRNWKRDGGSAIRPHPTHIGSCLGLVQAIRHALAFIGDHVIRRKHTVRAKRELPGLLTEIVQPLGSAAPRHHPAHATFPLPWGGRGILPVPSS